VLGGEVVLESAPDDCDDVKFRQWEQELREDGSGSEQAVRLEVQARLLRFAQRAGTRRGPRYPEPALSRADELACYIARNYAEPLTSVQIAAANSMHPNYAMNLFRRAFGTTMSTFITQHRISHAQRLLVTTDDSILSIAFGAGFQSSSRFNAAFKAVCGSSPRQYRREHRGVEGH
jgi:AraC-like DNA-binding protein